jgi:hypothetical protein
MKRKRRNGHGCSDAWTDAARMCIGRPCKQINGQEYEGLRRPYPQKRKTKSFVFFTRIKATNVEADDLRNRRMQEVEAATLQGVKRSKQYQWCGGWGKNLQHK